MEKNVMLEQLINYYTDGNKSRFAAILGIRPQTINSWIQRNSFDSELIYAKCANISADWLLSGDGEMIKGQPATRREPSGQNTGIELIELRAENKQLRERVADLRALLGLNGEKEHFSVQVNTNKKE